MRRVRLMREGGSRSGVSMENNPLMSWRIEWGRHRNGLPMWRPGKQRTKSPSRSGSIVAAGKGWPDEIRSTKTGASGWVALKGQFLREAEISVNKMLRLYGLNDGDVPVSVHLSVVTIKPLRLHHVEHHLLARGFP